MSKWETMQDSYICFCQNNNLQPDQIGLEISHAVKKLMLEILQEGDRDAPESASIGNYSSYILRQNSRVRNLLLLLRQFYSQLEWLSASYSQAIIPRFFDLRKQTGDIVNYDRWESFLIADMEEELRELYQLDDAWSLLLTSSGMAAYATIHNFITRYLYGGDNILIPVPVYHEAEALLSGIPDVNLISLGTTDPDEIVAMINKRTKVIVLTSMTNNEAARFVDLETTLEKISQTVQDDQEIFVVVDGTMCGGLIRPEKMLPQSSSIKLLYFESGNKYQQIEDTGMKGIVIVPSDLSADFKLIRQRIGAILYDQIAACLPCALSYQEFSLRMRRFSDNALHISQKINSDPSLQSFCTINYPLHPNHPDYQYARRYSQEQIGGVVTFSFHNGEVYDIKKLNNFIQHLIDECQAKRLPFCKGDSYGFSFPRIHVGGSKTSKPYLRLSVGNRSLAEVDILTTCLIKSLRELKLSLNSAAPSVPT
ncbi:MAG: PLP-dependent transferase [Cyanobacteria bacterium P01_F01_bin.150]